MKPCVRTWEPLCARSMRAAVAAVQGLHFCTGGPICSAHNGGFKDVVPTWALTLPCANLTRESVFHRDWYRCYHQATEELRWYEPKVAGEPPSRRSGHSFTVVGNLAFLFGGALLSPFSWQPQAQSSCPVMSMCRYRRHVTVFIAWSCHRC